MFSVDTYAPLDVPKQIDDNIWIIDGPVIGFQNFGFSMPFPTRMTIVRLSGNRLFVH